MAAAAAEDSPLGLSQINAVFKEPVPAATAADFTIAADACTGASVTPAMDCGLPPDLDAFVLDDVLSSAECAGLIAAAESAQLTFWDTTSADPRRDYRNADTVEVPTTMISEALWRRVAHLVPARLEISADADPARSQPDLDGSWVACGTNSKLLIARYLSGGHFSPHTDGYSVVDFNHRSMFTLLIYLNDCRDGGGTRFYRSEQLGKLAKDAGGRFTGQQEHVIGTVQARRGRALFFFHNLVHEGVPPGEGEAKYIIRSDLMYRRDPPICDSDKDRAAFALYQDADELSAQGRVPEAMAAYRRCAKMSPALASIYGL
mmetsp:Transcript_13019/g.39150  ORF Transcript_13019/g.39150 Transcript_13019/m.39150 type:complete len:318 (+) Transcript_13019:338-1291(+)